MLTGQTDAGMRQARTQYDALGRPVSIQYGKSDKIKFSYGKKGSASGKLTEIRENTGSLRYGYTAFGELASLTQSFTKGVTFTQSYTYDKAGRISAATLPGGQRLAYSYDSAGRLAGVKLDGQPILTHMHYDALGGITNVVWGNGLPYKASYDVLGRIVSQTQGKRTVAYGYDKAGNIVSQGDRKYIYDKLDRLVGATKVPLPGNLSRGDIRYQYDANGNRVSVSFGKEKTDYAYQPGTNRLSKIGDVSLKYDAAGNLLENARFTYSYNVRNRLSKVSDKQGNPIATYTYNALGLRTSKTLNGKTIYYVYNPNGMLAAEADEKGRILRQYVWLGIRPLVVIEGDQTYYIHTNHLGTPRVVTDTNKKIVWQWQPTPFGMGKPVGSITLNLRFPGQYFDQESGLYYNGHRYFDPATGRYITSDPVGLYSGANTYLYAEATPVDAVDPAGKLTLIVHGTWAKNEPWHATGSQFNKAVSSTFGEQACDFRWSGGNTRVARSKAAARLAQFISYFNFLGNEKLNLVAHSHGGNVVKEYSNLIGIGVPGARDIDVAVNLGAPQRKDYVMNYLHVANYINAYSNNDTIQTKGGNQHNWPGIGEFGPAGRTDPLAFNVDVSSTPTNKKVRHTDLHTLSVWNFVARKAGL